MSYTHTILCLLTRYLHSNVPQYSDPSSLHRLARAKELPQPNNVSDILSLLGDTSDPNYPIYRTATGPDGAATLATGELLDISIIQLMRKFISWSFIIPCDTPVISAICYPMSVTPMHCNRKARQN